MVTIQPICLTLRRKEIIIQYVTTLIGGVSNGTKCFNLPEHFSVVTI